MKIEGTFDGFGAPRITVTLINKKMNIEHDINFLIDTGASRTVIADTDAIKLGLDYSKLHKTKENMTGIGGVVDTYAMRDTKLHFVTNGKIHVEKLAEIFVIKHIVMDEKTKELVRRIPSLLGRDILGKYTLFVDDYNRVFITDELKGLKM